MVAVARQGGRAADPENDPRRGQIMATALVGAIVLVPMLLLAANIIGANSRR